MSFNWNLANWSVYEHFIESIDWNTVFISCVSCNDYWAVFKSILLFGNEHFVPKSLPKDCQAKNIDQPRFIKNLILKKKKLWRIRKLDPSESNTNKYNALVSKIKLKTSNLTSITENKILQSNNLGKLYKHINARLTHKTGIAPLYDCAGNIVLDDATKAEVLNKHFVNVGKPDNGVIPLFSEVVKSDIDHVCFDSGSVFKIISGLKSNSAAGPDSIPACLLKNLKTVISYPLSVIFNLILQTGVVPDEWKRAIVTPVFKKGNSSEPNNYRPISLTSIVSKIFESVIKMNISNHLANNNLISKNQHGFLSLHSTTTNLMECMNDWTSILDSGEVVKVLYIDFMKAFDVVSVPKLLYKLKQIGIKGMLLSCIESFLTSRKQCVRVCSSYSDYLPIVSGVPQGSVLGPFLFLIFINDLTNILDNDLSAKLFADDLKSYQNSGYRRDPNKMQSSLDAIVAWAEQWQLSLSVPKCGSVLLQSKHIFNDTDDLFVNNVSLPVLNSVKDLGVIVDCRLSFEEHISSIVNKAKQRIYLIFKSFTTRNINVLVFAYKTYILPIVDYCSNVWCPSKLGDIDRLEKIQRYFTKRLQGLWDIPYCNRLQICCLPSLEQRRLYSDLILCFKIVHKLIALDFDNFFVLDPNTRTRGHNFKLLMPKWNTQHRHHFFAVRIVPVWNSLSFELVNSQSVNSFKTGLFNTDLNKFLLRPWHS